MNAFAIGSYTQHATLDARGRGISLVNLDEATGTLRLLSEFRDIRNPTYLHFDNVARRLYSVCDDGTGHGAVSAFDVPEDCNLGFLVRESGPNRPGCHIVALPEPGRLFTASYSDGRLTGYPIPRGIPEPYNIDIQYRGTGPVYGRQDSAHAHQVMKSPHGGVIYVCDLGSDRVWMHRLEEMDAPPVPALTVPGGYGPRHLAFDPDLPFAYLLCELVPRLLVVEIDRASGLMKICQELDTVTPDRMNMAAPAAVKLHPSGRTLAVSNRFDDTVTVFRIGRGGNLRGIGSDTREVKLEFADRFSCHGMAPRDIAFNPEGSWLLIANQDSHGVTCRRFDRETGLPAKDENGEIWGPSFETGSPVCLVSLD